MSTLEALTAQVLLLWSDPSSKSVEAIGELFDALAEALMEDMEEQ